MIIVEKQNEAQMVGDIQVNRVGIDSRNVDFIATLLTSSLYSKPLASFLRETVSNAYDSHIEAGTKEPIILLVEGDNWTGKMKISIRDFGTGISPERFETIYKNIGSSTKRESNDFIGMFGIGRFSVLSCASVANITSYYNGVKYSYLMYKNNGGINIDKLDEEVGDFKNGLEVSAEMPAFTTNEFREALYALSMFRNLHVECHAMYLQNVCTTFNNRRVVRKGNLLVDNINTYGIHFKVGNVLYPATNTGLSTSGIIIELPMGQVDITPNREALQYSDFTKNTINTAIASVKNTFQQLIQSKIKIATLSDYYKFVRNYSFEISLGDKDPLQLSIVRSDYMNIKFDVSVEGEKAPDEFAEFLNDIDYIYADPDNIYKIISNFRRYKNSVTVRTILEDNNDVGIKADAITKQVTLQYYREKHPRSIIIFTQDGLDSFKRRIATQLKTRIRDYDIRECMDFMFKHIPVVNVSNDSVPSTFVEEFRKRLRASKNVVRSGTFLVRRYSENGFQNVDYIDFNSFLKHEVKVFAVYDSNTTEHTTLKDVAEIFYNYKVQKKGYGFYPSVITVKKSDVELLKNRKKFVHINDFLYLRNNFLEKLVTAHIIFRNFQLAGFQITRCKRYREFKATYNKQLAILGHMVDNETFDNVVKYYVDKGWYNTSEVEYFKLSEEDIRILNDIEILEGSKGDTIEALVYRLYGRKQHLGINRPDPNSNIYKIIKSL